MTAASVFKLLNEEEKENAPEQKVENATETLIIAQKEDNQQEEEHKVPYQQDAEKETAASTQPTVVNTE